MVKLLGEANLQRKAPSKFKHFSCYLTYHLLAEPIETNPWAPCSTVSFHVTRK
uniref:Uncharacterized protein n=1 Tax=Rhizophora mucronata TaxID=61149 RepID=A0A2P2K727_RHIMU